MAKTTNCAFCGKELTKGFFTGDVTTLDVGLMQNIECCEECCEKYKKIAKHVKKRFSVKCETLKKKTKKKLTSKDLAQLFLQYARSEKECVARNAGEVADKALNFFSFNDNGYFSVREFSLGFAEKSINVKEMIKSIEKAQRDTGCICFDKSDITRIEYAPAGIGDFNGLFQKVYSYDIRLNDETVMTYKPTITRATSYGGGFLFGYRKSAEKRLLRVLNEFKKVIGSDLPIVKVKKI